ncbi:SET and MYND domain-containing protein 4 [Mortierella alpina]|uniref:SET and MYND domain-containing protein 4 n=1 Tax=Mortierella alpina TaxID=64518 RepID=A0A9P6J4J5_MORAP|nr:SET and MYND domain-containing protein 4 [Mortierella alpina]
MATLAQTHAPSRPQHSLEPGMDHRLNNYPHAQLAATFKEKHTALVSFLDKPVAACYAPGDMDTLMALPEPDLLSIKEAFVDPKRTPAIRATTPPGLDPVPKRPIATENKSPAIRRTILSPPFKIGFSKSYGHAVQLNKDTIAGVSKNGKVDSGTYLFEHDETPYACVIESVWRGKLCEECLRFLPTNERKVVVCPGCDQNPPISKPTHSAAACQPTMRSEGGQPKFCSQECLNQAWKSWHGYECAYQTELDQLCQRTRLALRTYWKDCQNHLQLLSATASVDSTVSSLTTAAAKLTLVNNNAPRITDVDGSTILPTQLCSNFTQLDSVRAMSFLMTGYYLERLFSLPPNSALELAHLQALVQFNSFAIKSRMTESSEESNGVSRVEDFSIGSGLYLLASMFNHSCAPNAMVVFGGDGRNTLDGSKSSSRMGSSDPRAINVITTSTLKVDKDLPVLVEISYGPQGGRMATEERKACLQRSHLFECNCSACNDRYAGTITKKIYKCPSKGYACRAMAEEDVKCPTCGVEVDMAARRKMHQLMGRLLADSQDPSLSLSAQLTLLKTLESAQSKVFVNTSMLYGNTCDQLAMVYAQSGDLAQSIEWCKRALKVVVVHFPHDSIEVAQETLKLAGLLFNNSQPKEAMKQIRIAITLYKGHYGAASKHPDLLELYEMERVLEPIVRS